MHSTGSDDNLRKLRALAWMLNVIIYSIDWKGMGNDRKGNEIHLQGLIYIITTGRWSKE